MRGGAAATPDTTRRNLDQRRPRPDGLRQRGRVVPRESRREQLAELLEGTRFPLHQLPAPRRHLGQVKTGQPLAVRAAQRTVQHRLDERTQRAAVRCRDQVDGAALQCDPDHPALLDQLGERLRAEAVEA